MATQKKQQTNAASEHSAPRRPGLSLRTIAALIVIGVGLALVLLLVWSAGQLRAAARQETMVHAQAMVENMAWRYDRLVTDTRAVLTVLAQLPRLADDPLFCGDLLRRQQVGDDTFANLGVIGLDGQVLCSALPFRGGLYLGDRSYFRRALETRGFAAGTYQVGRITGESGINFGYPVRGADGEVAAVVFAAVGTRRLAELIDPGVAPDGATVMLLDHHMNELMRHPASAPDERVLPASRAALAALIEQQPHGGHIPLAAGDAATPSRHYAYLRLGRDVVQDPPYLVLGWPPDVLTTTVNAIAQRQPPLVLVALSLLAAVAWLLVNAVVMQPVRWLAAAAARLAAGEHGVRLPKGSGVAELVAMSDAFNQMANRIDGAMRAYAVLSAGNRSLLREPDEERLLQAMCGVAVEVGGYRCAWVSYLRDGGIQIMACAGDDGGFAAYLQAHWQTALDYHTPTAQAIASGQPVTLADARRPAEHDLFAVAAGRGLLSGLVLPLKVDARVIGVLTIYSVEADAFHERERRLLAEMADDLSFGIATARMRERERATQERLRRLAYFDEVTGLPNRAGFLEQLHTPAVVGRGWSVMVIDVHNYWDIAAALGHACGDEFLQVIAGRLRSLAPAPVARLAQSEFALWLEGTDGTAACHEADRLLAALAAPAALSTVSAVIDATAGVAVGSHGEDTHLVQAARLAAREARLGQARVSLARPQLEHTWRDRLRLAADLRTAIDDGALQVYLQPQVDLSSGLVCGAEALARWRHPQRGDVSPTHFIGVAEQTGLIGELTHAMLDGVRRLASRHAAAGVVLPVAVNVSARNLHDPDFVARVTDFLHDWPLPRDYLHLELTETAVMVDPVHSLRTLQALSDLGLPIYLDDFGTGHSSLAYLRELPLNGLKIDRAFVSDLARPSTWRIVTWMIDLAHALGLRVVAEGVEDDATAASLAGLGCDQAQGYGIARPMPGVELADWLTRWPGLSVPRADRGDGA